MKRLTLLATLGIALPTLASAQEASQPQQMMRNGERCACCRDIQQQMQQMRGGQGMQMPGMQSMQQMPQGQASSTEGARR
jgi:hypothetical protein